MRQSVQSPAKEVLDLNGVAGKFPQKLSSFNDSVNSEMFRKAGSIEASWNRRQEELRQSGLTKNEQQALHIANRRNTILASLKKEGGPFTSGIEVDQYLNAEIDPSNVQKPLRDKMTNFRDTCTSLPRSCNLFKLMTVDKAKKKRRVMTEEEFGRNLKVLLGKS